MQQCNRQMYVGHLTPPDLRVHYRVYCTSTWLVTYLICTRPFTLLGVVIFFFGGASNVFLMFEQQNHILFIINIIVV